MKANSVHLRHEGCMWEISSPREMAGKAVHLKDRKQCTIADKKKKKYSTKLATQDKLQVMRFGSDIDLTDYYHKGHQACGLLEKTQNVQRYRNVS